MLKISILLRDADIPVRMKIPTAFKAIFYSFPVQLVVLHFRKYQVLLLFWVILFSTVNGNFMHAFGADSLFLAPEYLDHVSTVSSAIVGVAIGIFVMSWNITTFILHFRQFRFLATTTQPFLKYCLNNSIIPLVFLIFYLVRAIQYNLYRELMPGFEVFALIGGFTVGFVLLLAISLLYFFGADRTIMKRMAPIMSNPIRFMSTYGRNRSSDQHEPGLMRVDWYLAGPFKFRKTRNVSHYSSSFLESVFKQHHVAAVFSIFIAFIFLLIIGFLLDNPFFQLPAAASITMFFSILIAVSGAFSLFLQSWSIPVVILLYFFFNTLYKNNLIDTTNKAYGVTYSAKPHRAQYNREALLALCADSIVERDKAAMLKILEAWKAKQTQERPMMYFISVSGGGNRSATFTMNVLQRLDSITGGQLMKQTVLISGASGGMLGAAYFRELYLRSLDDPSIRLNDRKYVDDIGKDLLNATFSSFVARDMIAPAQRFSVGDQRYIKDRAYAFENRLNENTRGFMKKTLADYADDEKAARIPLLFFNSVITRDGRKMVTSAQPVSFMMRAAVDTSKVGYADPDAVDFCALLKGHTPEKLRVLTAMRMNATFPYVLPNVWLPTDPVIDVMDAGLRDNFGQETALRFISHFSDWINENTGGVVLLSIRDRQTGGWEQPYVATDISELLTKPVLLIQHNWHKLQDYYQNDQIGYAQSIIRDSLRRITFQYVPRKQEDGATLNFHLSLREKNDIAAALDNPFNSKSFALADSLLRQAR